MKFALALAAIVVTAIPATSGAGPCPIPTMLPTALTPGGAKLDQHGGVVVGLVPSHGGDRGGVTDLTTLDWQFAEGSKRAKPTVTLLAPGLALVTPVGPVKALDLQDARRASMVKVTYAFVATLDLPTAAAPKVTRARFSQQTGPRSRSESTTVELAVPPPAGTIAVLIYDPKAYAAGKPARSWVTVGDPKATTLTIHAYDRCMARVPGMQATVANDRVVLVWLSAIGHRSLVSSEITITADTGPIAP